MASEVSTRATARRAGLAAGQLVHDNKLKGSVKELAAGFAMTGKVPARWHGVFEQAFTRAARPHRLRK